MPVSEGVVSSRARRAFSWGGEESCCCCAYPGPRPRRGERIRARHDDPWTGSQQRSIELTVSNGCRTADPAPELPDECSIAPTPLYRAKALGRNRVEAQSGLIVISARRRSPLRGFSPRAPPSTAPLRLSASGPA